MFLLSQMGGVSFGIPDVNKTPPVALPIPYPNFALHPLSAPAAYNILIGGTPGHTLESTVLLTLGDQPGIELGIVSEEVMGPSDRETGMFTLLLDFMPATRLTSFGTHNGFNAPGVTIVPSQFTVMGIGP